MSAVNRKREKYHRQLRGLFESLGYEVSESDAYAWSDSKRKSAME